MNALADLVKVEQDEIRIGDTILPVYKARDDLGQKVVRVSDGDGDLETDDDFYDPKYYDFYMVKRAPINLPTTSGSAIRVTGVGVPDQTWVLTGTRVWVSHHGENKLPHALESHIQRNNRSVKVLS